MPYHMTVNEAIQKLQQFNGDAILCGTGHFGEVLSVEIEGERLVSLDDRSEAETNAVVIYMEQAGEEPFLE